MRILGVDPGTAVTGFGLIECRKNFSFRPRDYKVLDAGVIKADVGIPRLERLRRIHEAMNAIVGELKPNYCAIEAAFFGCNAQSALKLGEARGALIAAVSNRSVSLRELAPTKVKRIITGKGHSKKHEVSEALYRLLGFQRDHMPFDVTDALAIALSFALSGDGQEDFRAKAELGANS